MKANFLEHRLFSLEFCIFHPLGLRFARDFSYDIDTWEEVVVPIYFLLPRTTFKSYAREFVRHTTGLPRLTYHDYENQKDCAEPLGLPVWIIWRLDLAPLIESLIRQRLSAYAGGISNGWRTDFEYPRVKLFKQDSRLTLASDISSTCHDYIFSSNNPITIYNVRIQRRTLEWSSTCPPRATSLRWSYSQCIIKYKRWSA